MTICYIECALRKFLFCATAFLWETTNFNYRSTRHIEFLSQKLNCSNPEKKQLDVNGLSKRMKHLHIHYNWKENDNTIRLEDISLVYNRNDKRNKWTSKDDNVRAATV